jgi:teichuronic acid biosynthesis glycosyltransferase TuaG
LGNAVPIVPSSTTIRDFNQSLNTAARLLQAFNFKTSAKTRVPQYFVSIVTPAYNAEHFLRATIASVRQQSYSNWEMLVIDDCSRDGTRALIEREVRADARVRLVGLDTNSGPAMARQAGVEAARGSLVAFLDSDDVWLPHKLERQVAFMRKTGAAFSFTAFRRMSGDGSHMGRVVHVPPRLTYRELLGNTAIATSTAIIDRAQTGPFRMVKTYYDDFALWLEITRRGFPAFGLDEDLMRYRVLGGSVSRNKARSAKMVWRTYREVEHLGLGRASWAFARYAVNALRKYSAF